MVLIGLNYKMWPYIAVLAALLIVGGLLVNNTLLFPVQAQQFKPLVLSAASDYSVPWQLIAAQISAESDWQPDAVSPVGAQGISQFMPGTAADFNIDPFDPEQAIPAQAEYMAQLYQKVSALGVGADSWAYALAAYNWGIGNVTNALNNGIPLAQWPQATRNYVAQITAKSGIDATGGARFA